MSKQFRKYRFGSKGAYTTKSNALGVDEEGNATHSHLIVELGYEILTPASYNEDGDVVSEAVFGDGYLVDCLWNGEADPSWNNQMVWTKPFGQLVLGGSDVQREWLEKCKENRPELFPEPTEKVDLI